MYEIIFQIVFSLVATAMGIYYALGIWYPKYRTTWRRSTLLTGPVSCAGLALLFVSIGLLFPALNWTPFYSLFILALPILLGAILIVIGFILDIRANKRRIK